MRQFKGRDPLFYYDVVSVLGVGSMGSVAKVRKRDAIVGGSARKNLQRHFERERRLKSCFEIPIVGGLFRFCLKGGDSSSDSIVSAEDSNSFVSKSSNVASSSRSRNSSILNTRGAAFETFGDSNGSEPTGAGSGSGSSYEQLYAMKSIHLSRVTDPAFVEELKNEIQILRSLDHPRKRARVSVFYFRSYTSLCSFL
jgi:serine/threonine protein kinase